MGKDILNFDQFQELREGICGRKDVLMIGVDAAKRKHVACFRGPSRKVLVRGYTILNSRSGLEQFREVISETKTANGFNEVIVAPHSSI